ncbi:MULTISPECIES: hypothetical protein [Burkholderia]|uniref:hypothetical protein n=1 Tax=Burkholderia TaxID=32008 RepID=UPI000A1A0F03|nr:MULTISPECIES: hypothetical protein [Burkholderia]ARK53183.1 hypothetical protein BOC36_08585 [Burkholderia pseudomallei]ARL99752.1 hypothetical protein BOC59_06455 [Burkholderia pseudomallei]NRE48137.1 hypothetical protein [Burkholderia pseudomallei]
MRGKHPIAPEMAMPDLIRRPLRDLITGLARVPTTLSGEPDYSETDPDVLVDLAESAELLLQIVHEGLAAIGLMYAHTADQIAEGHIKAAHAAALGRLQAELGELLPYIHRLLLECRRYTADYVGD